ncbi:hypothetical protein ACEWY4_004986 [Coilia grayii]|uniref:Tyrosine-protein kinase receptor n=1 Tax=Coilia grayii TaxID=363190 RepID=A0ABD1KHM7_9TELE
MFCTLKLYSQHANCVFLTKLLSTLSCILYKLCYTSKDYYFIFFIMYFFIYFFYYCYYVIGVSTLAGSGRVYFSEGTDIWTKAAGDLSDPSDLKHMHSSAQEITGLSVDWLYKKLYFISGGKVYGCSLEDCTDAAQIRLSTLGPPIRIKADPYNGWLFLLLHDGIHRAILPDASGDLNQSTSVVVKSSSLHDFVVSVQNRKLVYFLQESRALSAVSLDGSSPVVLRSGIRVVDQVQSLAYEDSQVVLTDGQKLYQEVRDYNLSRFNEYLMDCEFDHSAVGGFDNLLYVSRASQPHPVPRAPRGLTALFGSARASLRWREPQLRVGASPSAWQNWTYTITVSTNGSVVSTYSNVTESHVMVTHLLSSQHYTLAVTAESPGGQSIPVLFEGTTLQNESDAPYIVAASNSGLWKQQLDDYDFIQLLADGITSVRDMDWYNGTVYWTDSAGRISYMTLEDDMSRLNATVVPGVVDAEVVAFDWLGRQLYWNCNRTQICRGRPSSAGQEVVVRGPRDITAVLVDPLNAFVYWSTAWSVESAWLNGEARLLIQELSMLSGRQVAGLTLDLPGGSLFWLVQDGMTLHLHKTHLLKNKVLDPSVSLSWSSSLASGAELALYSGRLLWLDADQRLLLQELSHTTSVLMTPDHKLSAFTLVQSTLKPLPDGFLLPPVVIPQAVPEASVCANGNASVFRVTWAADGHVNYGSVFYCVESDVLPLQAGEQGEQNYIEGVCPPSRRLSAPVLEVTHFAPNTPFRLAITPYTYWGKGDTTFKMLRSPGLSPSTETDVVIIAFGVLTGVLLAVIITAIFIWFRRRSKKAMTSSSPYCEPEPQGPDEELEQIRGLVGMANGCYAVRALPLQSEIDTLPVFPRDRLKLQRLLGSGAFGEVYEGVATGVPSVNQTSDTRVAVKTLKKGATDDEKSDFLKEAHLMSQFAHPNILRLLGVCLLNEPQYLILELMEGGDLRSYLMDARPASDHGLLLNLYDLLDICLDVAKGCAYLEKMHFVHRDLAARNCLVSVQDYTDPGRVVKIGDFGLSRDIYKNDYYRKRGEGLLPVRWMSPESLSDGVFNKYSDVWAFGVLLWEVVSLGKQPYPALTNLEVVHHINSGGRLLSPTDCPKSLYDLMLACWSKTPKERPSFRHLEGQIRRMKQRGDQLTEAPDESRGIVNYGFQSDEECCGVDEDESPGDGLTHVLSEEGLNYLMFSANDKEPDPAQLSGEDTPDRQLSYSSDKEATATPDRRPTRSNSELGTQYLMFCAKDLTETSNQPHPVEFSNGEGSSCIMADNSDTEKPTEHSCSASRSSALGLNYLMFSVAQTQATDAEPC